MTNNPQREAGRSIPGRLSLLWKKATRLGSLLAPIGPRRIWNAFCLLLSYRLSIFLKRPFVWGYPLSFSFEPTTACNLRCPDCVSGLRAFSRPVGTADLSRFQEALDQLAPRAFSLTLYFQGEPMLHPRFTEMVRRAKAHRLFVQTSSNGHFLDSARAREVVLSGLDQLVLSVDGATQDAYSAYRLEGDLQRVIEGIGWVRYWKQQLARSQPYLVVQVLAFRHNEHQLAFLKKAGIAWGGDEVRIKSAQIHDLSKGEHRIPRQSAYSRYRADAEGGYSLKQKWRSRCRRLWLSTVITWDGRVLPCCFDKDAQHEMGTLDGGGFRGIWHGEAYRAFREGILSDQSPYEICSNCSEGCRVWVG